MRTINWLKKSLSGLIGAISRFPLTSVFLLVAFIINIYDINAINQSYMKYLFTFIVGAIISAVMQVAFERWYSKVTARYSLMGLSLLLTAGYYLIIMDATKYDMELTIRTVVVVLALIVAFILIPVIKSNVSFNQSFMVIFKSFFIALFFSGIIFLGINIILAATDQLITSINSKAYSHTANIVFLLFAPIYFLSLIPVYPGKAIKDIDHAQQEKVRKAIQCPKFLEVIISYILIPLLAVFTLILVIYIVQNIRGEFWTDNLLEPMLVSYSITVILVYILASELENKFTVFFRKIFPKLLVPIVIFQIIASVITLTDIGVTHTRYYVILFGIFAAISGVLLSFLPVRKNSIIALIFIIFCAVSIIPPVDAFTISKNSQINLLEETLVKNEMFKNNTITPKESIPNHDKEKITNAMQYLSMMNYTKELSYLPNKYKDYEDFHKVFGFDEYQKPDKFSQEYANVSVKQPIPISVKGYDFLIQLDVSLNEFETEDQIFEIEKDGHKYYLQKDLSKDNAEIKLLNEHKADILVFNTKDISNKFSNVQGEKFISIKDASFHTENDQAKIAFIAQNIDIVRDKDQPNTNIFGYVLIKFK